MKQSGHLNPSEETVNGCPVTSKYGRTPPSKHGGVVRQQHELNNFRSIAIISVICKLYDDGERKYI